VRTRALEKRKRKIEEEMKAKKTGKNDRSRRRE
jgi:hypothetical protein